MRTLSILMMSALLLFGGLSVGSKTDAAEQYPVKPIMFIVALEAGADGDIIVRPIVQKISTLLGQPVVIVNKPGAGSTIGYREIHAAKPDGYTIGWGAHTVFTTKFQGLFPYDHHDFTLLYTHMNWYPVLVSSNKTQRPFKTFNEFYSYAKSHPGEVSIATSGVGQSFWIFTVAFLEATGLKCNIIPQPGAGGFAIAQVAGGHTDLALLGYAAASAQLDAGNVNFLTVVGPKRASGKYGSVPALNELGYDMTMSSVNSIFGPPKLPKDITDKLIKAIDTAVRDPEYQAFLTAKNANALFLPGQESVRYYDEQYKIYRVIMERHGLLKGK